ncbi:MAG TPA: alkaline phosphatase family protein [Candidatus Brocadiia bacterium]|nr:alkaline phosphatase family protein [Candidatus Brocadiia bacterium]
MNWEDLKKQAADLWYSFKYFPLVRNRPPVPEHPPPPGFIGIQIDALSGEDLEYAIRRRFMRNTARLLAKRGFIASPYRPELPYSTSQAQCALLYGYNENIPAFRWYEKRERRIITFNDPACVQHIRDRIPKSFPGVLEDGSSYINLYDGDAARSVLTASAARPSDTFTRLGGYRVLLMLLLHPIAAYFTIIQLIREFAAEISDRWTARREGRATVVEGVFPLVRMASNVVIANLQTACILADIHGGVPYIYTTYMAYDEMAHHFGPRSPQAMLALRNIDRAVGRIARMSRLSGKRRAYRLVILSDHGMHPSVPFERKFGRTLAALVQELAPLDGPVRDRLGGPDHAAPHVRLAKMRVENWNPRFPMIASPFKRRLLKLFMKIAPAPLRPETFFISREHRIVVTYSSSLALLYFADAERPLLMSEIRESRPALLEGLVNHPGIGIVLARGGAEAPARYVSKEGSGFIRDGQIFVETGKAPFGPYIRDAAEARSIERLATLPSAGDLTIFGAFENDVVYCFDDQVGAHGCPGGRQGNPFIIVPESLAVPGMKDMSGKDVCEKIFRRIRRGPPPQTEAEARE